MRQLPFVLLISAAIFALMSIPLLAVSLPFGLACTITALLLCVLALPDLTLREEPPVDAGRWFE